MSASKKNNLIVCEFNQESNSFNPEITQIDSFQCYEGEKLIAEFNGKRKAVTAMLDVLHRHGVKAVPACSMYSQSGGRVNHDIVRFFLDRIRAVIQSLEEVDGLLISLHGATQSTECEDVAGLILQTFRDLLGSEVVIAASLDLHANITKRMVANTDFLCGFKTYPHIDYYETGERAATLVVEKLLRKNNHSMVKIGIPMIIPANGYSTLDGEFRSLMEYGNLHAEREGIVDFSIFMMQPWLDVHEASSGIVAVAGEKEKARSFALLMAKKLFSLRWEFKPEVHSVSEIILFAENNDSGKPVVLVDCADSSNAGATGDGAGVLKALLEAGVSFKAALVLRDAPAADQAHEMGVGAVGEFQLGGTIDSRQHENITVQAKVKSCYRGIFTQEGPAGKGTVIDIGPAAVLQIGKIDVLVCHKIAGNGDPQLFRAFGMEPAAYQLVAVKACTSFKVAYQEISSQIYQARTSGAASSDLYSLGFSRLPRPFHPFESIADYDFKDLVCSFGNQKI